MWGEENQEDNAIKDVLGERSKRYELETREHLRNNKQINDIMYMDVWWSVIHRKQELETNWTEINRRVFPHHGILCSHQKEWIYFIIKKDFYK